jgi:hypothetical protein
MVKIVRLNDPMNQGSAPSNIMVVGQSTYGIISPRVNAESGIDKLETYYLSLCIGLALVDRNTKTGVLAHIDIDAERKLRPLLRKLPIDRFEKAIIVYGEIADKLTLEEVRKVAREHAGEIEEMIIGRKGVYQSYAVARLGVGLDLEAYLPSVAYYSNYMDNCAYKLRRSDGKVDFSPLPCINEIDMEGALWRR